jgi:hypothetical protein
MSFELNESETFESSIISVKKEFLRFLTRCILQIVIINKWMIYGIKNILFRKRVSKLEGITPSLDYGISHENMY